VRMRAIVNLGLNRLYQWTYIWLWLWHVQVDLVASESYELLRDRYGVHDAYKLN
jgi:hypothetical protein